MRKSPKTVTVTLTQHKGGPEEEEEEEGGEKKKLKSDWSP